MLSKDLICLPYSINLDPLHVNARKFFCSLPYLFVASVVNQVVCYRIGGEEVTEVLVNYLGNEFRQNKISRKNIHFLY